MNTADGRTRRAGGGCGNERSLNEGITRYPRRVFTIERVVDASGVGISRQCVCAVREISCWRGSESGGGLAIFDRIQECVLSSIRLMLMPKLNLQESLTWLDRKFNEYAPEVSK